MYIFNKYVSTLMLLCLAFFAKAQKQSTDKIYWVALDQFTLSIDSGYHPNSFKDKTIYLQKPEFVDSIPPAINGYKIVLITAKTQKKLYREHKKKLTHTIMFPIAVLDSVLYITITPYFGSLKGRRHYYLRVSEGTTVYFKFDATKKTLVVDKVKNWGI